MERAVDTFVNLGLILSGVVFVIAFFGNLLSFGSRFGNALLTAVITAAAAVGLILATDNDGANALSNPENLQVIGVAAGAVFIADFLANMLSFSNRFVSAIVTAVIFAALFAGVTYLV